MPAAEVAAVRVWEAGGVTTRPEPGAVTVTAIVLEPVSAVAGFTVMLAAVPGPVAVLQLTLTGLVAVSKLVARIVPAHNVSPSIATNALQPWAFINEKSIKWTILSEYFSTTMRGGGRSIGRC